MKCKSGKHEWLDEVSAQRCCNGWHQELRVGKCEPEDDSLGRSYIEGEDMVYVWVKDKENK